MNKHGSLRNIRLLLEWLTFISIVALIAIFALTAGILPPPPPHLYREGGGFVAEYGMRPILLLLFLAACALIALLFLLSRFPRLYRYPVKITAGNVEVQYLLAKIMLGVAQLVCAVYFSLLMLFVYRMQIRLESPLFACLTAAAGAAVGVDYLVYLAAARKNR